MRPQSLSPRAVVVGVALTYALAGAAISIPSALTILRFFPDRSHVILVTSTITLLRTFLFAALGTLAALAGTGRLRVQRLDAELLVGRMIAAGALGGVAESALGRVFVRQLIAAYRTAPVMAQLVSGVITFTLAALVTLVLIVRVTRRDTAAPLAA